MTDGNIELTRRKILASAGAVGAAGAAAGLGTSALFSDEESVANNSITAGTLDMRVAAEIVEASRYYTSEGEGPDIIGEMETADGSAVVGLQAEDVKPGDWIIVCFDISIEDNPGYVRVSTDEFAQYENGQTQPEIAAEGEDSDAGSPGKPFDGEGKGELQDELVAEVYDSYDGMVDSDDPRGYLSGPNPNLSGSARTVFEQFATGVVVGGGATPIEVGTGDDAVTRYLLLELPAGVGNEIQTDAIEFDLVFDAVQVRNNDGFEPSSSLVGYWPLNTVDGGTAEDLSSNGNDGDLFGDVSSVDGKVADAASFDGDGDYIEIEHDPVFDLSDFTVDIWFKTDGFSDEIGVIVNKQDPSGQYSDRNWWLAMDNGQGFAGGGHLGFRTSSSSGDRVLLEASNDYRDGEWHRAVGVVSDADSTAELWVDGTEEDSQSGIGTPDTQADPIQIGKEIGGSGRYFGGAVDDVRIYDRALSDSEI